MSKFTNTILTLLLVFSFLVSNFAYPLAPPATSGNLDETGGTVVTKDNMAMFAEARFAEKIGPGSKARKGGSDIQEFTGDVPQLVKLSGDKHVKWKVMGAKPLDNNYEEVGDGYLSDWEDTKNWDVLKEGPTILHCVMNFIKANPNAVVPDFIGIGEVKVNEDGGSIPIAQDKSDPTDGKTTLVVSRKFARIFQQIAENDVLFEYYPKWGEGKEETRKPRVVSVAKGLLYRLMKHEMRDGKGGGHLKEDGFAPEKEANMIGGRYALVNDAICLWFVGAYCFTDSTRYDNITLKKRLKYLRKESGMDFDRYFPNLSRDGDFNEAVEIALGVNYMFFNRRQPGEDYLFKAIDYRTLDTENERATTAIDVRKALRDLEAARPRVEAIREINIDSVKFGPEGRKYILDKKNRRVVIFPAEAGITDTGSAEKAIDLSVRINEAFSIAGFELDENGNIYVYSDKDSTIFSFTALGAPGKAFVGMGDTGFKTVNVKRGKITAANDNTLYRSALAGGEIEIVDALTYKTFSRGTKKVDLDINGNYWFLCEGYEGRVAVLDEKGERVKIGPKSNGAIDLGNKPVSFDGSSDMALSNSGGAFVLSAEKKKVIKLTEGLLVDTDFGNNGVIDIAALGITSPLSIERDNSGAVFVIDRSGRTLDLSGIKKEGKPAPEPAGNFIKFTAGPSPLSKLGQGKIGRIFNGEIYVMSQDRTKIGLFDETGDIDDFGKAKTVIDLRNAKIIGKRSITPAGFEVDNNGNILIFFNEVREIYRIKPKGGMQTRLIEKQGESGTTGYADIAVSEDRCFALDQVNGVIHIYDIGAGVSKRFLGPIPLAEIKMNSADSISSGADGEVCVFDSKTGEGALLDKNGDYLERFRVSASSIAGGDGVMKPVELLRGADGKIYAIGGDGSRTCLSDAALEGTVQVVSKEEKRSGLEILSTLELPVINGRGPGAPREVDERARTQIWETVNALHKTSLQIFLPERMRLDNTIMKIINDVNKVMSSKGLFFEVTDYEESKLAEKLQREKEGREARRIVIFDSEAQSYFGGMLKAGRPISTGDIEGFRDVKVLPVDNARGRFNRDLNYKLHVLRTAILACLLEEEDNSTNRVIREALEDILSDTNLPEGQYGRFFRELSKRETAGTPSGDIAKRLSYFVNEIKAISLINTLFQEWKRDEKFWTYA